MSSGNSVSYSVATEDYLKAILEILRVRDAELAPMGLVADALSLTPGTITTMIRRLKSDGLATYEPRKGCGLTSKGRAIALRTLRRHRVLETFLVRILEMDWSNVHDEAERMEHGVSDVVIDRLWEYMDRPGEDPHGGPIPGPDLSWPDSVTDRSLDHLPAGRDIVITRIPDRNPELLKALEAAGIGPGQTIKVERAHGTGVMVLLHSQSRVPLSLDIAKSIRGRMR